MSRRMETCCLCGESTGRAGAGEDSMYFDDIGPWCEECYRTIRDAVESGEVERLRAELGECRRLLQFVIDFHDARTKDVRGVPHTVAYVLPYNFLIDAGKAAGGGDEES